MDCIERSAHCRRVLMALVAGVVTTMGAAGAWGQRPPLDPAQWRERCKSWLERKGYPVDYIEQKTGKRQVGMAQNWKGNVKPEDVRAGDVVIRSETTGDGRTIQIAGFVDEVEPASGGSSVFLSLSAMGIGGKYVDMDCFVTTTFGQVSTLRVPLTQVLRVWRPSLALE